MDEATIRRKDTTKGPPLRILSLGKCSCFYSFSLPPPLQADFVDNE